jgi:ribose transport system ATP-binding protein
MNEVIVSMNNISKSFPGVKALDHVKFELRSGEVMALLGENGAGKSTLMKILSGVYTRDEGTMEIFGKSYDDLTPKQAQEAGVAIIHQELNMCRHLTVTENMFLGREVKGGLSLNNAKMRKEAKRVLDDLRIDISPDQIVGDLPVSKQQMVEIAKALSIDARILIMDEPTSSLTAKEIDDLFRIIRKLRDEGRGIVYISHRLEELSHIVDRVTIMRDGQYITDGNFKDMDMDYIIKNMVGREIKEKFPRVECRKGKKIFEVKNLNAGKMVRDINFSLYEGEIVGFAGLMGAGRTETTRAIFGVDPKDSGEFYVDGKKIEVNCPMDAIRNGVVLAPEDRKKDGLCTKLSIRQNLALPNLDLVCNKMGVINSGKEDALCEKAVKDLQIKTPNVEIDSGNLSGGNQQKAIIAREIDKNPELLIAVQPTRGLDVGAIEHVHKQLVQARDAGKGVLLISLELDEVMNVSDRILVMYEGEIVGEFDPKKVTVEELGLYMAGSKRKETKSNE